ncbi:MAG: shikimate kinase [Lachnospiraceae bacterium]|nr:shikimate kinase [Lachnospiraceae bacterium]
MSRGNIVLIGMPTSGKSTVGVIAAKILGMDFVDTDIVIQRREGARLCDIIEKRGLEGFLECEEQALLSLEVANAVIATGGSAVYSQKAMESLKKNGTVVYLKLEKDELFRRLKEVKERGVVLRNGETLEEMFEERVKLYEAYADITVSEENSTIEDTVKDVTDHFR